MHHNHHCLFLKKNNNAYSLLMSSPCWVLFLLPLEFIFSSLLISRKAVEISHIRGKLYVCTRRLDFVSCREPKVVATTTTTKSCDQHLLYYHPTILFSPFPRAYKANLTARPLMIQMMRFKFQGGSPRPWSLLKLITSLSRRR